MRRRVLEYIQKALDSLQQLFCKKLLQTIDKGVEYAYNVYKSCDQLFANAMEVF